MAYLSVSYTCNLLYDTLVDNVSNSIVIIPVDCIQECFLSQPPSIVYLNEGDSIILSVDVNTDSKVFFTTFKDGTLVTDMNNVTLCDPKYCIFDMDSPRLEITSFNASFSVGSYRLSIRNLCDFPFNISQAGKAFYWSHSPLAVIENNFS